jgi:hypothetical protein
MEDCVLVLKSCFAGYTSEITFKESTTSSLPRSTMAVIFLGTEPWILVLLLFHGEHLSVNAQLVTIFVWHSQQRKKMYEKAS